jgi:CxxC motif-containing protein (DUF1111 family)
VATSSYRLTAVVAYAALVVTALADTGCASDGDDAPVDPPSTLVNASDVPIDGLSPDDVARFDDGDRLFGVPFRPVDGLGPLYVRTACSSCHAEGGRGPGLVQKMALVGDDGVTPLDDQSALVYGHTIREGMTAGAMTPITAPANAKVTVRIGPPVLGRGYIEAVDDAELIRVEAEQAARGDGIHGKINRVLYASVPNPDATFGTFTTGAEVIGKFGVKARVAMLDDFTADAFQGDMGLTTPMRPTELPNPDGLVDDERAGVDLPLDRVDRVAFYLRHIAIPKRVGLTPRGTQLFERTGCATCHVPTMHTRRDYPIAQLADIDAPIYTDLLLHDLGAALADGNTDGTASSGQWRTSPLIGLRFMKTFMHDGRAHSVEDAILAHDGEARAAADSFRALPDTDRTELLKFVEAL